MDLNMENRMRLLKDPGYVLNRYREDVSAFWRIPYVTVRKICRLIGTEPAEIAARDSSCSGKEMLPQFMKKLGWIDK